MAGAFLINQINGISMSGVEFTHITEAIRDLLKNQSQESLEAAYRPMDEGGMDFVSLKALDRKQFAAFYDAACKAYGNEQRKSLDSPFKISWQNLLDCLATDPRLEKNI